jgi:hypothetical protein
MGKDPDIQPTFTTDVLLRGNTPGFDRLSFYPATLNGL